MFSRWKLLLLMGYPKSSWWRSALACCRRSLHLGKDGKLNPCLYFLRIRGISKFCGISPFPRSQSGCRTREILASTVSAIRTLPSGYHCQGKKIHFETKSQKYSKTTGRDSRSNSFYWSSQARILLLLCSFASWLRYLSTWLKLISFFLTEMHSKL